MQQNSTTTLTPEQMAGQLLFLFELMPDETIQQEGVSPSEKSLKHIRQWIRKWSGSLDN
ncbi:hypothetical protein LX69_00353 [Breznakibacter xylanolyticus]|uniref:Uncharacterized protein n=1 Tax=Breznakibacter xylanolyticus TaxID=990 RepID=A0A2W7P4S7_9BACT|nr:hypothetical protein [Breznakibacter xylanolyticus]MBN2745053.1 hypothetical protein [Marinilabiliaceae bacterium]PZX20356.1 hypothetical protein LX69_00353 [Breznakibacter xylanolyticus]